MSVFGITCADESFTITPRMCKKSLDFDDMVTSRQLDKTVFYKVFYFPVTLSEKF